MLCLRAGSNFSLLRARSLRFRVHTAARGISSAQLQHGNEDLFRYTSGRWIYNEPLRQKERHLNFNLAALQTTIAHACNRRPTDLTSFTKLSEGGFNRISEATFTDGKSVLARLPYPATLPKGYAVASEVATMDFLRGCGIRTPVAYTYSSNVDSRDDPVGAEYIIMKKLDGIPLGELWFSMKAKDHHKVMKQIVELETRFMGIEFSASGSFYCARDLRSEKRVMLPGEREFCVGPIAQGKWWDGERGSLDVDQGPWLSSSEVFTAVGQRESTWIKAHGKPRLHYERLYRELHDFKHSYPNIHAQNLSDYLHLLAPHLGFKPSTPLNQRTLRHPDIQPNNILIDPDTNEITGLIDWQHSSILLLCLASGISHHFQNWGDPVSESLQKPNLEVPDYNSLPESVKEVIKEVTRKQLVHFVYAAYTARLNRVHFETLLDHSLIARQKIFECVNIPWEGDSISLHAEMICVPQDWSKLAARNDALASASRPSISYSDSTINKIRDLDAQQKERDSAMQTLRDAAGVDIQGWVPDDEAYAAAKEVVESIRQKVLEVAETEQERVAFRDHFPFDVFDPV